MESGEHNMADEIKEIGRLLDEGAEGAAAPAAGAAKSRLVASLAEALRGSSATGAGPSDSTIAAFLDGRLGEAELAEVTAALARDERLRAELESAAALVDSVAAAPRTVPQDLLARAQAKFAPEAAPPRGAQAERSIVSLLSVLWPGRSGAWATAAVLLLVVAIGAGALLTESRFFSPGLPPEELNAGPGLNENENQTQHPNCEDRTAEAPTRPPGDRRDNPSGPKSAVPSKEENPCPPPADENVPDNEPGR
jgi:hypothetical protein